MSDDALLPLRRAYGAEVPGSPAAGPAPGAVRTETAVLVQTRAAVEASVAAQDRRPSAAVLAAVLARAAVASTEALAPLAAVRALYGETADAPDTAEAAILSQTRAAVELALRPAAPSAAAIAAVVARAADATRHAPRPDDAVAETALVPLAVAYGLPTSATPDAAETALLVQTRDLLDRRPVPAGPSNAVLAAVLAKAASTGAPAARPDATPADRPAAMPAADRSPLRDARRFRRVGAWTSAAAVMLALIVALMPRAGGAPEVPAGEQIALAQADLAAVAAAPSATPSLAASAETALAPETPSAPAAASMATVPPLAAAPPTPVQRAAPLPDVAVGPGPSAPPPNVRPARPAPRASRPAETRASAPTTALASADVTAAEPAWDAPADVRVLSLRLQALGRNTADLGWDQPAEAFGSPSQGSGRSTPGVQSVRETRPAARARLSTDFSTGDR